MQYGRKPDVPLASHIRLFVTAFHKHIKPLSLNPVKNKIKIILKKSVFYLYFASIAFKPDLELVFSFFTP